MLIPKRCWNFVGHKVPGLAGMGLRNVGFAVLITKRKNVRKSRKARDNP